MVNEWNEFEKPDWLILKKSKHGKEAYFILNKTKG
jgi:hypothetical protein